MNHDPRSGRPHDPVADAPRPDPDSPARADTYRRMVDPEAASFETPDLANMRPGQPPVAGQERQPGTTARPVPAAPAPADPAGAADTYRRMVDPEAATFETPDQANMRPGQPPLGS